MDDDDLLLDTRDAILDRLAHIERTHSVRILFAAEAGSRAWGFESPDSDYDVRFIYVRNPREYLRIDKPRDVIELPIENDLDINGWDLFKGLGLFLSSNPPLMEWLHSPIIYLETGPLAEDLRGIAVECFSPLKMTYHCLNMSKRAFKENIEGRSEVSLKKYLYALRPLVCIRWIESHNAPPPTRFNDALNGVRVANEILESLSELLQGKSRQGESFLGEPDQRLNAFIVAEQERITANVQKLPNPSIDAQRLNALAWREFGIA